MLQRVNILGFFLRNSYIFICATLECLSPSFIHVAAISAPIVASPKLGVLPQYVYPMFVLRRMSKELEWKIIGMCYQQLFS